MKPKALTALQPTNLLHMGNLFGAILPMVELQKTHETFLFVVDYHAITVPQDPKTLTPNILFATAAYLAAGVDPKKTVLFQQSAISEHTELAWILNCFTHMGELERMTQYKEKAKEGSSVGLFDYPVLMAADILLYDTDVVPVGEDQKQHVELARDLAERFNKRFGKTFVVPKPEIRKVGARIMGLDDPTKKMSKSSASPKNYISLMDDADTIRKKIQAAVTDSGSAVTYDPSRPAISNLLTIFSLVTGEEIESLCAEHDGKGYATFKKNLAEALIAFLQPTQTKIQAYLQETQELLRILENGKERAHPIAAAKLRDVKQKIGVCFDT
jgi:tryptophanyl-tRNA synthetase